MDSKTIAVNTVRGIIQALKKGWGDYYWCHDKDMMYTLMYIGMRSSEKIKDAEKFINHIDCIQEGGNDLCRLILGVSDTSKQEMLNFLISIFPEANM